MDHHDDFARRLSRYRAHAIGSSAVVAAVASITCVVLWRTKLAFACATAASVVAVTMAGLRVIRAFRMKTARQLHDAVLAGRRRLDQQRRLIPGLPVAIAIVWGGLFYRGNRNPAYVTACVVVTVFVTWTGIRIATATDR